MVEGVVRLHCLSDVGIFVQSPVTNLTCGWHVDTVCKVPTNCEMVVLDNQVFADKLVDMIFFQEIQALILVRNLLINSFNNAPFLVRHVSLL